MSSILPSSLAQAAARAAQLLHKRGETVSIAETAAGGLISASLLATPGASKIYAGGLTLYTLKSRLVYAGWSQADIDAYRGPTGALVSGIAKNVNGALQSTYTICESGTAGPTGGNTRERTPGFVALAVALNDGTCQSRELQTGSSNREGNMVEFAVQALILLTEVLDSREKGS